jgi:drug/metabolite transporter (DMT)-like permease
MSAVADLPWPHSGMLAMCILLTATAQLLLKAGASRPHPLASFLNPQTAAGYALLAGVTLMMVYVMQRIELKVATAFQSVTFLLVLAGAMLFLRERVTRARVLGSLLIVAGIAVFFL